MRKWCVLLCVWIFFFHSQAQVLEFNVVYPVSEEFVSIHVVLKGISNIVMLTNFDNLTHVASYEPTDPLSFINPLQYHYVVVLTGDREDTEPFWRMLEPCRLQLNSQDLWRTKYEYFKQSEIDLGLSELPILSESQPAPFYFDDNQIMTLSFHISTADLDSIIFNPNDKGDTYVKSNFTMVSLSSRDYYENTKIRRAGGVSLRNYPYSYQVKFDRTEDGVTEEVTIKLKAYPMDYDDDGADIIAEKASADICRSVGAPINYVSYVRVIINGMYQGMYGLLEKVDEAFVERRWPYEGTSHGAGTLYKTQQAHWYLLTDSGWQSGIREYCEREAMSSSSCCPCFDNNCNVDSDCDVFDDDDEICHTLSCCKCTWESNGSVDVEFADCMEQSPFADFVTLGDTVLDSSFEAIEKIINTESYVRSSICSLAVMNADGYVYNGKNYYWYRDSVSGQFFLVLYDQDTSFTRQSYVNENWDPWSWPLEGNLSDALFLPIFLQNNELLDNYNRLFKDFLEKVYRPDQSGPLYSRMKVFADFISKYNPERGDVLDKTDGFINWFITPQSQKLVSQFDITLSSVVNSASLRCNFTSTD